MWDTHNHILNGIDDGPKQFEESLVMWRQLRAAGYTGIVATPHRRPGMWNPGRDVIAATRERFWSELEAAGEAQGMELRVGAEHFLDAEFMDVLERDDVSTLGPETSCFLIEFPVVTPPPNLRDLVFRFQLKRLCPVIAHPERYEWLFKQKGMIDALFDAGCLMQIDLPSLVGLAGRRQRKRAEQLIKNGQAHLVATDVHNARDGEKICAKARARVVKLAGEDGATLLFETNPAKIVRGDPPPSVYPHMP